MPRSSYHTYTVRGTALGGEAEDGLQAHGETTTRNPTQGDGNWAEKHSIEKH